MKKEDADFIKFWEKCYHHNTSLIWLPNYYIDNTYTETDLMVEPLKKQVSGSKRNLGSLNPAFLFVLKILAFLRETQSD